MIDSPGFRILKVLGKGDMILTEIAKAAGISPSTAHEYLSIMFKKGMLTRKEIGKSHVYSVNLESFLARHMKILISLDEINSSGIMEEIKNTMQSAMSIVLYGSAARGDDNEKSDIDILIIIRKQEKKAGLKSAARIKRIVNTETYTLSEWRKKSREDKVFYEKIIIDGIPLYGELPVV